MINQDVDPDPEDFAGLLQRLQETPNRLASIVEEFRILSEPPALAGGLIGQTIPTTGPPADAGGSDKALRWRNSEGEFSALENICHLRDIEAEGYAVRINRILDETNPFLGDIDGGRLAVERSYNEQDPELALRAFTVARAKNLEKLSGVKTDELSREGTLEGIGQLTLKRLVEMMREHDEGHVEELSVLQQRLKRRLT